jgi:peptidoglycan/LPS O-acetylase OafA/YrhL
MFLWMGFIAFVAIAIPPTVADSLFIRRSSAGIQVSQPSNNRRAHLPRLDAVRALAILSVFLYHSFAAAFYAAFYKDHLEFHGGGLDFLSAPSWVFLACYPLTFGWVGVSLFFVLSGFVIHYSFLVAGRRFSAGGFFVRRFWRIYPPYLLALTAFALWAHLHGAGGLKLDFGLHLALIHNLILKTRFGQINGSFWSVAVEVQFYLAYPLMLWLRGRIGMANVAKVALGLAMAGLVVVLCSRVPNGQVDFLCGLPTNTWFDWVLGAFVAERFFQGKRWMANAKPALAALAAVFVLSTLRQETSLFSFTFASIFFAVALECWVWSAKPLNAMERMLVPVGLCSYSLYLWHQPLITIALNQAHRLGVHSPAALLLIALVMFMPIYALSWILYLLVEQRVNDLGKALVRSDKRTHPQVLHGGAVARISV